MLSPYQPFGWDSETNYCCAGESSHVSQLCNKVDSASMRTLAPTDLMTSRCHNQSRHALDYLDLARSKVHSAT